MGEIRGVGAMVGVEFVKDRETKEPAPEYLDAVLRESISRGLVTVGCGLYHNVLRHLIPLVISDDDLEEGLDVLAASAVAARRSAAIRDRAAEVEGELKDRPPGRVASPAPGLRMEGSGHSRAANPARESAHG